jgi:hypothetical protein
MCERLEMSVGIFEDEQRHARKLNIRIIMNYNAILLPWP